jgi:hypothetical protein
MVFFDGEKFGISITSVEFRRLEITDWHAKVLVIIKLNTGASFIDVKDEALVLRSRLCSLCCLVSYTDAIASDEIEYTDSNNKTTTYVIRGDSGLAKSKSTPFFIDLSQMSLLKTQEWCAVDRFGKAISTKISESDRVEELYGTIDILGKVITNSTQVQARMREYLKTISISTGDMENIITNRNIKIHENKYKSKFREDFDLLKDLIRNDLLSRLNIQGRRPLIDPTAGVSFF